MSGQMSRQERRLQQRLAEKAAATKETASASASDGRPNLFPGVSRSQVVTVNEAMKTQLGGELLRAGASEAKVAAVMEAIGSKSRWTVKRLEQIIVASGAIDEASNTL